MRTRARIVLIAGLCAASLAACVTPISTSVLPANVQSAVLSACSLEVQLSEIAKLLSVGSPGVSTALGWADVICGAFANPAASNRSGMRTAVVNGVVLHGVRR